MAKRAAQLLYFDKFTTFAIGSLGDKQQIILRKIEFLQNILCLRSVSGEEMLFT